MTKNIIKMIINIALTVLFVVLLGLYSTGAHTHNMLGKVTAILAIAHIILGFPWIKSVAKNLFNKKLVFKTKLSFILNILIFAGVIIIIISCPKIPDEVSIHQMSLSLMKERALHMGVTYITLGLIGIHIGLHTNMISSMFAKLIKPSKKVSQALTLIAVIVCLSAGLFGIIKGEYFKRVNPVMNPKITEMYEMEQPPEDFIKSITAHNESYPVEKQTDGKKSMLYGFLSLIFFASFTYAVDKYLPLKKA